VDRTPYTLAHPATNVQLVVATAGVSAGPSAATRNGVPGTQVVHTLTITDSGSYTDTFQISPGVHAWQTTLPASVTLAAGASTTINVRVTVPASAAEGASESLTLTIASSTDPQLRTPDAGGPRAKLLGHGSGERGVL